MPYHTTAETTRKLSLDGAYDEVVEHDEKGEVFGI
jgi:hypothetical protein